MKKINLLTIVFTILIITSILFTVKWDSRVNNYYRLDSLTNGQTITPLDANPENQSVATTEDKPEDKNFWIKVVFSSILLITALYIIVSKKYDDETKKWAFSMVALIAGVWIGTVT